MIFDPYGMYMFPGAKRLSADAKVYRENSKKCKSCKRFDVCSLIFEYHDYYKYKMRVDPNSIACSKYERRKKK